jgi:hypothetical protein
MIEGCHFFVIDFSFVSYVCYYFGVNYYQARDLLETNQIPAEILKNIYHTYHDQPANWSVQAGKELKKMYDALNKDLSQPTPCHGKNGLWR